MFSLTEATVRKTMNRALPEYSENHEESKTRKRTFAEGSRSTLGGSQQSYSPHSRLFTVDSSPLRRHTLPAKSIKIEQNEFEDEEEEEIEDNNYFVNKGGRSRKFLKTDTIDLVTTPYYIILHQSYLQYPPQNVEFFIDLVYKNAELWDPAHYNFRNQQHKIRLFDEIEQTCHQFMPRGRVHGRVAQQRWMELKKMYFDHRRKVRNARSGSGASHDAFIYGEKLRFLDLDLSKENVENAYVVGNEKFGIAEIPKLKADAIVKNDSNIGKNDRISDLVAEFNESSTLFKDFLSTEMRKGEVAKKQYCGSERICAVFKEHVKNLSPIGIIAEEAKVINFITSLSSSSNYSSPIQPSISSPKDPNLNAYL
uniref:MADF domain-containing protein n=2 Tax=Caenorhabditis japonica TaxID=281687 RepID=A0A8R1IS61_CAEJA